MLDKDESTRDEYDRVIILKEDLNTKVICRVLEVSCVKIYTHIYSTLK